MTSGDTCSPLPALGERAVPHLPLQQRIAQVGPVGFPRAGCQIRLLDVSIWVTGYLDPTPGFTTTQKMMQGHSPPAWHKEGIPRYWMWACGILGSPGSCWCSGE